MKFNNVLIKISMVIALLIVISLSLTSCKLWTVVKLDEGNTVQQETVHLNQQQTDIKSYVASIWDSQVIPYMVERAAEVSTVLNILTEDLDKAGEKYGIREYEIGTPWKFIVRGQGKIISVNTESRNGTLSIDIPPYDEEMDLNIQIGPVFKGNLIRDSLDFISFGDFKNQIEFSKFGSALNDIVREQVVSGFAFEELSGREVNFIGVFTAETADILLTPVKFEVVGGNQ